jgi:precorrin-2 methylase
LVKRIIGHGGVGPGQPSLITLVPPD